jgi:hypothetical protein
MGRWLKRFFVVVFLVMWLVIMLFPCMAFNLALREEIQIGSPDNHVRIFLLSEKQTEGIGVERKRPFPAQFSCTQTTVTYLLWVGEGENVQYCHCTDPLTGDSLPNISPTCQTGAVP